jgi:flagellar biosynthetic protein FliP
MLVCILLSLLLIVGIGLATTMTAHAQTTSQPSDPVTNALQQPVKGNSLIQLMIMLTLLTLAPAVLICMTSFTRIIVVLSFIRNAIGTPQMPPNQVLIGMALFLSLFVMSPVISAVNTAAVTPYMQGKITQQQAFEVGIKPIREFMFKQTDASDLSLFISMSSNKKPKTPEEVSTTVLVPAFIISELKKAFIIAFLIYIPFLIIDIVVAGTLMSMGMMMLPPMIIALPFKILLFVMVDGWHLVVQSLVQSFK